MTPADRARLRALAQKATPGPWTWEEGLASEIGLPPESYDANILSPTERVATSDGPKWKPNAAFIAACDPATVLALLDIADAAEAARISFCQIQGWARQVLHNHEDTEPGHECRRCWTERECDRALARLDAALGATWNK